MLTDLPSDALRLVLARLEWRDVARAGATCRALAGAAREERARREASGRRVPPAGPALRYLHKTGRFQREFRRLLREVRAERDACLVNYDSNDNMSYAFSRTLCDVADLLSVSMKCYETRDHQLRWCARQAVAVCTTNEWGHRRPRAWRAGVDGAAIAAAVARWEEAAAVALPMFDPPSLYIPLDGKIADVGECSDPVGSAELSDDLKRLTLAKKVAANTPRLDYWDVVRIATEASAEPYVEHLDRAPPDGWHEALCDAEMDVILVCARQWFCSTLSTHAKNFQVPIVDLCMGAFFDDMYRRFL